MQRLFDAHELTNANYRDASAFQANHNNVVLSCMKNVRILCADSSYFTSGLWDIRSQSPHGWQSERARNVSVHKTRSIWAYNSLWWLCGTRNKTDRFSHSKYIKSTAALDRPCSIPFYGTTLHVFISSENMNVLHAPMRNTRRNVDDFSFIFVHRLAFMKRNEILKTHDSQ